MVAAEHERHRAGGEHAAEHARRAAACERSRSPGASSASPWSTTSSTANGSMPSAVRAAGRPTSSQSRIARGPKRVPGRYEMPSSNGAPRIATSAPASSAGSRTSGCLQNVGLRPACMGGSPRPSRGAAGWRSSMPRDPTGARARRRVRHNRPPGMASSGGVSARIRPAEEDRDRRHEVGGRAHPAGAGVGERVGPGGEGDRGGDDAEIDDPGDRAARSRRRAGRPSTGRTAGRRRRRRGRRGT